MKKRGIKALAIGVTMGLLLTGCGSQFPEMSDEEYDRTVQYAVSLLMKYSNNGVERLSSLSALELQRQIEKEDREKRKAERDAANEAAIDASEDAADAELSEEELEAKADEETGEETDAAEEGAGKEDSDVKVDVSSEDGKDEEDIDELIDKYSDALKTGEDAAEGSSEDSSEEATDDATDEASDEALASASEETPEKEEAGGDSSEELTTESDKTVDGMRQELSKGIFLTYSGYSVAASYPDDDDVFVITADPGKKLLVLNFRLANTGGSDVTVDMAKSNPHFQVILNKANVGYTNVTWLDNDLSSFAGTIKAGEKLSMVLVKQLDASKVKSIDSLGLIGTLGDETITFNLE